MTSKTLLARMSIHLNKKIQIAFFFSKKVIILDKYSNFKDEFFKKKALILLEQIKLNKYTIELKDGKQLFYKLIYILDQLMLKIFKPYIKTNLKTEFIWHFKFSIDTPILFAKKLDDNLSYMSIIKV